MEEERKERGQDEEGWEEWSDDDEDEKGGLGEKWSRDPVEAAGWAAIFIWAGLVLLADNLGFLVRFERLETWGFIFIGASVIVLLQVAFRLLSPPHRRPVTGSLIFAAILLAIGLGDLIDWDVIWPLVPIVIGVAIIVGVFTRAKRP